MQFWVFLQLQLMSVLNFLLIDIAESLFDIPLGDKWEVWGGVGVI